MSKLPRLPGRRQEPEELPVLPLALLICVICGGAFFGLLAVIFPGIGFMGIALLLLAVFFWLQYLVWGKWIYGYAVRKEKEAEAAAEADISGSRPDGSSL